LSPDFIGDDGDSNGPCLPLSSFANDRGDLFSSVDGSITNGSNLSDLFSLNKSCAADCSGHGRCLYRSILSEKVVISCKVMALDCYATCDCDEGYRSSTTCALSDDMMLQKAEQRERVIDGVASLVAMEDLSRENMEGWMNSLVVASKQSSELNKQSTETILSVSSYLLQHAATAGHDAWSLSSLLFAVDAVKMKLV
jgi:hypothetical protein